jgi:HlyD family secretion protein
MKNRNSLSANILRLKVILLRIAVLAPALIVTGCQDDPKSVFQGYAEGEYVMVAAPLAGQLESLTVTRGSRVQAGELLFTLDREEQQAEVTAAGQELRRTESRLADLRKGERPSELEAIVSRLEQARAAFELSSKEFARREKLFGKKIISSEELDQARTAQRRDQASINELKAQLETARLGARSDAIEAARADVAAARARLQQASWAFAQKSRSATQDALVYDTLFEPGEFVPAGYPVVSLLPTENIKLRFFVPEPLIGTLQLNQKLAVGFDGDRGPLAATISYISPQAEYTPPVIFSRETRAKLVFLVEARPDRGDSTRLHPGQPIEVRLESLHE